MDVAAYWVLGASVIPFALFGAFYASHKTPSIVLFGVGVLCLDIAACLYWVNAVTAHPDPTLEEPTFIELPERVSVIVGTTEVWFPSETLESSEGVPLTLGGFSPVRLKLIDEKLYADIKLFNGTGLPPIEMHENRFIVRPPDWDRNANTKALEVVNEKGIPIFQLIYEKPNRIRLRGIFAGPHVVLLATEGGMILNATPSKIAEFSLKPIFKYPAWKYPGQYAD